MFTLEFAEDFSGLTAGQIRRLEKEGILQPLKERGSKYYTYGDIYVLRIFKILRRVGITHPKIEHAFDYLRTMLPEQPLSSFVLLHNCKEIFTVVEGRQVIASKWGQMILDGIIQMESVGSELEATRQSMNRYVNLLRHREKSIGKGKSATYNIDDIERLFA